ncbi:MAG: single-stranded DNA-binding protein [Herpetosiphonaceae bacterium]|nr:MAG: single-stranded DNA-binding protein [Herpetosiphonaceae bacterium]
MTTFRVASNRSWKSTDGQTHEDTEWFSVVAWNKLGEICNQYLTKGTRVYIEGRLQTRSWDDPQTGEKRYKTEVIANDMIILDSRRDHAGAVQSLEDEVDFEEAPVPARPSERQQAAPSTPARNGGNSGARPAPSSRTSRSSSQPTPAGRGKVVLEEEDLPF